LLELLTLLHYPSEAYASYVLKGPDLGADGKPTQGFNHFTLGEIGRMYRESTRANPPAEVTFGWTFIALDGNPTDKYGADGPELVKVVEDYDKAFGDILDGVEAAGLSDSTNIVITLDHGKVDTDKQVNLERQLASAVDARPELGISNDEWVVLNEDGNAQV